MNSLNGFTEREGGAETLSLNVLVLYEDLETGLKASETLKRTVLRLEAPVDVQVDFWRFDFFGDPAFVRQVAKQEGDIVFLSSHGRAQLPVTVHTWFRDWLGRQGGAPRALAVLLDHKAEESPGAAEMLRQLSAVAQVAGVDVFLHTPQADSRAESVNERIHPPAERNSSSFGGGMYHDERRPFRDWGINE